VRLILFRHLIYFIFTQVQRGDTAFAMSPLVLLVQAFIYTERTKTKRQDCSKQSCRYFHTNQQSSKLSNGINSIYTKKM
jgi:hypothetical protein